MTINDRISNAEAARYLNSVKEATGYDLTTIARKASVAPSTLLGITAPNPRTKTTRRITINAVADALGFPLPPELSQPQLMPQSGGRRLSGPFNKDVPIHTLISVPGRRLYHWNQGATDFAPRPPGVALARMAFALRMPDHTMAGWRQKNELIYIDPTIDADEGDNAFIEIANLAAPDAPSLYLIRRLIEDRPSGARLTAWGNPKDELILRPGEMIRAMRIKEWEELVFG